MDTECYGRLRDVDGQFKRIGNEFLDLTYMLDAIQENEHELAEIYYECIKRSVMIRKIRSSANRFLCNERQVMLDMISVGHWISKKNAGWKFY